jgi:hypothetical protein
MTELELLVYLIFYFSAGATLKLGDDLLDEIGPSFLALVPLAISGASFGYLMTLSEWDLVLLTSIIIGVILSGKVDSSSYFVGFLMIFLFLYIGGIPIITNWYDWFTLLICLLLAAILDEKGNDWADKSASPKASRFFEYRMTLKVSVLLLSIPWPDFLFAAIGLWCFDIGYEFIHWVIKKRVVQSSDKLDYSTHL